MIVHIQLVRLHGVGISRLASVSKISARGLEVIARISSMSRTLSCEHKSKWRGLNLGFNVQGFRV